jgi:zinc protease
MSRRSLQAVAGLLLALGACMPEPPRFAFHHTERRGRFGNGLRFVLMPDPTTQQIEVDVRYDVGSSEDPPGKAGLAHLVEHLMFQQRPDGPSSPPLMQIIHDVSTSFNAYTDWDKTHYMTGARSEALDALVKIEALRLFYGCQTISPEEFLREREVVRNEIRERSGTAEGQIPQLLLSAIYPPGHAYAHMVGGDDHQLSTITLEDACGFIARYYAPERATLIVAGGFEIPAAVASLERWLSKVPRRSAAPRTAVQPVQVERGKVEHALDVEHPSVHVIWALPPSNTPEGEAVRFGVFSAFFRTAAKADEYEFGYEVEPQLLGGDRAPAFAISILLKDQDKLDEALAFVAKAARSAHRGFDEANDEQLDEWKNLRKAAFIAGLERLRARTNELGDLVQQSDVEFDSGQLYVFHELDKIAKFNGARVAAAIKQYLDPDRARVVVIRPSRQGGRGDLRSSVKFSTRSDDQIAMEGVDPGEASRPLPVPVEPSEIAGARRFALGNGLRVVILPVRAMPLVAARLIFSNAGQAAAPDNPALAIAAARFLRLPPDAFVFGRTGVNVGCRATADATICDSAGMNIYQDVVIRGLERLVVVGTYHLLELESRQRQMRGRFSARDREDTELHRQTLTALYGDHPYARTGAITPAAMDRLHLDAMDDFRHRHYTAGNATLIVVGDVDPAAAERVIRDHYGGWDRGRVDPPVPAAARPRTAPEVVGVVGATASQLRVVIAYPSPAGIDRQIAARTVLAEMLNLRVGDVRFRLGSTYGVYARREIAKGPTAYELGGDLDAERAGEAIKAIREGIATLRRGDHLAQDLVRARRKVVSELLGESTVTAELAARLGFIAIHDLPPDYFRTLLQQVAAVSPAQIQALIEQELDPSREVVVALGDRAHLERAFADAGLSGARLVEPADH